jgi:hypothetical protein
MFPISRCRTGATDSWNKNHKEGDQPVAWAEGDALSCRVKHRAISPSVPFHRG